MHQVGDILHFEGVYHLEEPVILAPECATVEDGFPSLRIETLRLRSITAEIGLECLGIVGSEEIPDSPFGPNCL